MRVLTAMGSLKSFGLQFWTIKSAPPEHLPLQGWTLSRALLCLKIVPKAQFCGGSEGFSTALGDITSSAPSHPDVRLDSISNRLIKLTECWSWSHAIKSFNCNKKKNYDEKQNNCTCAHTHAFPYICASSLKEIFAQFCSLFPK